ncbi:hypothetical protein TWF569_003006 [Orbilia oligospora]|nr:hypothetical protein TWF569_003006 [Orbilia oligospora]
MKMRISNIANSHSHLGFAIRSRTSASVVAAGVRSESIKLPAISIRILSLNIQTRLLSSHTLSISNSKHSIYLPRLPSSPRHPTNILNSAKIRSPLNEITLSSLPFIGHFFSTSTKKTGIDSRDMAGESESFAVEKTDQEWRAVLSRGKIFGWPA